MFAYVDETGNTGVNLFDIEQPNFITGALITRSDFDKVHGNSVAAIADDLGLQELHAKKLRAGGVNRIADRLLRLFKKADARFFLTRVEKKYLLAAKFADTLFDSYDNPAVPRQVYNIRVLRMLMLFKLASLLDQPVSETFWKAATNRSQAQAEVLFREACEALVPRVDLIPDERSKEIIRDALCWAAENPSNFALQAMNKHVRHGQFPNIVGFIALLEGIEAQSVKWNRKLQRLTHDRQMEFEASLAHWHEIFADACGSSLGGFWGEPDRQFDFIDESEFVVSSAKDSAGIQAIDIVIWLLSKVVRKEQISSGSIKLTRYLINKTKINEHSFSAVAARTEDLISDLYRTDLSADALEAAHKMSAQFEEDRRRNLEAFKNQKLTFSA